VAEFVKEVLSLMKISVVIPTYKRSEDLSNLLGSLLNQTVKPSEVIIVDDTPTAEIRNVCEASEIKFSKADIQLFYIRNPRERSSAIAKNVGSNLARGDIILFLDSDVILYPDCIEAILDVFKRYPNAFVVGGWTVYPPFPRTGMRYHSLQTLRKLFFLYHYGIESCNYPEYPITLTRTINCNWLSSVCMAIKRCLLKEFQFDENLREYAYMEDVLFSRSIAKRYSDRLFITPFARCIHKVSPKGREESSRLRKRKLQYRKYVWTKLLGSKGLLLFGWQILGLMVFRVIQKVRKWEVAVDEPSHYHPHTEKTKH
jgi:GT2 family glycosyltransferase